MKREELQKLEQINIEEAASTISNVCRGCMSAGGADMVVIAAAYVLTRSLSDYKINIDTIEYYLETAKESDERALFVKRNLGQVWNQIRELKYKHSLDEYKALLMFYEMHAYSRGFIPTPQGISKLAAKIMNIKPGMRILDAGTGAGNFIREAFREEPEARLIGVDTFADIATVAQIRAELLGDSIAVKVGDLFDDDSVSREYDAVFAHMPFGMKRSELSSRGAEYLEKVTAGKPEFSKLFTLDWLFNTRAYECVTGPGRAVCLMTNGGVWNTLDKTIRQSFLEMGLVEMVISLPSRIYEATAIGSTMIVFSHGNIDTMMVDATAMCEKGRRINTVSDHFVDEIYKACNEETSISRKVSFDEIKDSNYNLNPVLYISNEKVQDDNEEGVKLRDFCTVRRGAQISATVLDGITSNKPTDLSYLMLANIQDGMINDDLPYLKSMEDKYKKYCLKNKDIVLSKTPTPIKIAVADVPAGKEILANGNLYIITVDETKVDPYYLKAFLESNHGEAALKKITSGTVIPTIPVEQLKEMRIPLPPMEEQHKVALEYQACATEVKLLKRKIEKARDRMLHVYENALEG